MSTNKTCEFTRDRRNQHWAFTEGVLTTIAIQSFLIAIGILIRWAILTGGVR